jgi:hypothetical protein
LRSALGLGGGVMALGAASAVLALLAALWGLRRGGRATA